MTTSTAYTMSGPTDILTPGRSDTYTFQVSPPGSSCAADTVVTPGDGGAGGVWTPSTGTFGLGVVDAAFTAAYTPSVAAPPPQATLSATNNQALTNPASIAAGITPLASLSALTSTASRNQPAQGRRLHFAPGQTWVHLLIFNGLRGRLSGAACKVRALATDVTPAVSPTCSLADAGTLQPDATYSAKVLIKLSASQTANLTLTAPYVLSADVTEAIVGDTYPAIEGAALISDASGVV